MDARATIERGLVAALPDDAYSSASKKKTINGETKLNSKQSIFVITYMLKLQFAVEKAKGLMITQDDGALLPNVENFKNLNFSSEIGVAEVAAKMMAVTGPSEGTSFSFAQSQLRSGQLLERYFCYARPTAMMLPEFKEFSAADIGATPEEKTQLTCKVQMFDGSKNPSGLTLSLLKFNATLGEYSAATEVDNITPINFSSTDNITFTTSKVVPTKKEYAIRFKITSYKNELPETLFWADEFSSEIDPCGSPEGYVIGPDIEFKEPPRMSLFYANSKATAEGLDSAILKI